MNEDNEEKKLGPHARIEAALMKLARAAGTEAHLRAVLERIDPREMGPLGYFDKVTREARDAFASLERKGAHRLDVFLTGALDEDIVYGPEAESYDDEDGFDLTEGAFVVWPEDYPEEAASIFETLLLGLDGDEILGATKKGDDTWLWAVTSSKVTCLGEVSAFVEEGAAVLVGEKRAASYENSSEDDAEPPMPAVSIPPRDGTYRVHHPGTSQVRVEGAYAAGKKHGTWRWYAPDGTLSREVEFVDGLREGREIEWHPNGQKRVEGENRRGHRVGTWNFWYESGALEQRCHYDDEGNAHGEFVCDHEDGAPRVRGQFWHGARDGMWTWHADGNYEKVERSYDRSGRPHGEDIAWYPGGQLAYRRFFEHGRPIGMHEEWEPSGERKSCITYDERGVLLEKRTHADGEERIERFVRGLDEQLATDTKKLKRLAAKVKKANGWNKENALGEVAEYCQHGLLLMHLWREGLLDLPKEHVLFDLVAEQAASFSGEDVIAFLRGVELPEDDIGSPHLPKWPQGLDELVSRVYARDPEPIDAGFRELPAAMKRGVAFVLARFGKDVRSELGDLSEILAAHHAERGLHDWILWPERTDDGWRIETVRLFENRDPTPLFDEFLALYGDRTRFAEKLLAIAKERALDPVSHSLWLPTYKLAIEHASAEEMPALIGASIDSTGKSIEQALLSWRQDDAETLTKIALAIDARGLSKWPAVCCAILKCAEEGRPIDPALIEALELDHGSPSLSWIHRRIERLPAEVQRDPAFIDGAIDFVNDAELGPEPNFERARLLFRALRALPEASVRAIIERTLDSKFGKTHAAPYLHLVDDPALWERALRLYEEDDSAGSHCVALGLAHLPAQALGLLAASLERTTNEGAKSSFARAMVGLMARLASLGESWDPRFDEHITVELGTQAYRYPYIEPLLRKVIFRLPRERAEKVLLRELARNRPESFVRAFALVPFNPSEAVLQAAFGKLRDPEQRLGSEEQRLVGHALRMFEEREAWSEWLLRSGAGSTLGSAFKLALGQKQYEALKKSLESDAIELVEGLDKIDQLAALAKRVLGDRNGEPIYLLRRLEKPPADPARIGLNRIGGLPPGVPANEWPTFDDEPMAHLFTLDLATMPELRAMLGGKRTLSMFIANPDYNEAFEPYNDQTAIVMVDDEAAQTTHPAPEELREREVGWFEPVRVEVPPSVFFERGKLSDAIFEASARVLGQPIWLQGEEELDGSFVMQFDESFVPVNLGDGGVMYVYEDGAFWQCY